MPVQGIPCLEKWLFHKEKSQLAEKWHHQARDRRGLLIKLGEFCVFCHHLLVLYTSGNEDTFPGYIMMIVI